MKRSLSLKLNPHEDGGVSLTIIHAETEGDETSADHHSSRVTEKLPGVAAVKTAATAAVEDYFGRVKADGQKAVDESPIGRAVKKASLKEAGA